MNNKYLYFLISILIIILILILSFTLKPKNIKPSKHKPKYLGCFKDKNTDRALIDYIPTAKDYTSCSKIAIDNNYRYFGLQDGKQCFVGNSGYDKYGSSSNCKIVKSFYMGGPDVNAVYENMQYKG